jgi:type IV pilus assembly protein PilW
MRPPSRPPTATARTGRGFSIVEIMVGATIGIAALLIVYQVFAGAEGYKRSTMSGGDAQTTGFASTFLIGQDLASGGNTLASSPELAGCPSTGDFATTWRPIPALIHDGGAVAKSDAIDVFHGAAPILVTAVPVRNAVPVGADFEVRSPMGFRQDDLVIAINTASGVCEAARVTGVTPPDPSGMVLISHSAVGSAYPALSYLVNLGPDPNAVPAPPDPVRKVRYDVSSNVLRSLDLVTAGATPNPIASDVVLLKAQYGLDTDNDHFIDTWQSATGAWLDSNVLVAPIGQLRQIKAIRIAMIVRSAQFERSRDVEGNRWAPYLDADFSTTLFPCNGLPGCTGELAGVTLSRSASHRHHVFQQVIPLRSQIWNP